MGELINKPSSILSNTINAPTKPAFSPLLWVRSPYSRPWTSSSFSPLPLPILGHPLFLFSSSSNLCHHPLLFSCVPFSLLRSSCLSSIPSSPQGQLVCVELTTRQLLHCLLSLSSCPLHNNAQPCLANHQPRWQQYRTPT